MRPKRTSISTSVLIRCGIPKSFIGSTLKEFSDYDIPELKEVKNFIGDYIKNIHSNFDNNKGLFLCGSNGVGKSFLSCIILKNAYINRYSIRRVTFSDYIKEYTRMWDCKDLSVKTTLEENFYYYYKAPEFLVIEEIGKELDTKLSPTVLEDLLRYREEHGLPIIICTNLSAKLIEERYGKSIMSLIKGNCTYIKIVGKDQRETVYKER